MESIVETSFFFQYLIHLEISYHVNYKSMEYWKNVTIALPEHDLKEIADQLIELNVYEDIYSRFKR